MEIIRGKIPCAKKIIVYGAEGIGKSTFASQFPAPVFIDTEGSTKDMDVARFKAPTSWQMLMEQVKYVIARPETCKTLVIDTADWAEQLCAMHICNKYQKNGIEDFGYGKGYVFLQEEFGRLLNLLTELVEQKGVHVVLTAHAKMRKFEQPDEMGAYDRWEMKLSKQVSPLVKEWGDMILFANYKTHVVSVEGKNKAQGGARVMYTTHHPCWDAKNRYGLPEELPFQFQEIAPIIEDIAKPTSTVSQQQKSVQDIPKSVQSVQVQHKPTQQDKSNQEPEKEIESVSSVHTAANNVSGEQQMSLKDFQKPEPEEPIPENKKESVLYVNEGIPQDLRDLMIANNVSELELQNVVAARGYFPDDMPIWDYPPDFISGVLVAAWEQVFKMVKEMRETLEIPFD